MSVSRSGEIHGTFAGTARDPFERTEDDLLLTEAFARFDFGRPRKAQQWLLNHGVVDVAWMFPEVYQPGRWAPLVEGVGELMSDVLEQQRNVRWHLQALARLSIERPRAGKPRRDRSPHEGWNPAWAQVALRAPDGSVLWLGAPTKDEGRITAEMQQFARYEDIPNRKRPSRLERYGHSPEQFTTEWWPAAHAAWQRIALEQIPLLWYPSTDLFRYWPLGVMDLDDRRHEVPRRVGTDWHGLCEIERRLLRPYVRRAADRDLEIVTVVPTPPAADDELGGERWYGRLVAKEERWWRSLLAPIYLQLFEALTRISEGRPGAAFCRECGQPFLILDARRSAFCNDRERARWFQRDRRRRLAVPPAAAGIDP